MSFQISKGLFKFEFTDQHAILGVPLDADFNEIRKRYTKIARRLHPDSCKADPEAEKQLAKDLFAKLVGPAYNKFSKESDRKEYSLLLEMVGKRVVKEHQKLQINSELAKQLMTAKDVQQAYKTALATLAEKQYESISQTLDMIGQISELNAIYLLRKEQKGAPVAPTGAVPAKSATPAPASATSAKAAPAPPPPPKAQDSFVEQSCRRAEGFIASKNYAKAILELKEATGRDAKNSKCHALLGKCYLEQGQTTMAKIEIKKALELNPQEPTALEIKKKLDQPAPAASAKGQKAAPPGKQSPPGKPASGKKPEQGGGFFGGLFGGGKKK